MSFIQSFPNKGQTGGSGHTIQDESGTDLTARNTLQFSGDLETTDDEDNEKTVVTPHELTDAEIAEIVTPVPSVPAVFRIYPDAWSANNYMRCKDITDEYYNGNLKAEIAAGNFLNVHPGDYIIGKTTGTKYYVAECDHWFNKGDTALTTHHLTILPYRLTGVSTLLWAGRTQNGSTTSNTTQGMCPWSVDSGQNPQSATAQGQNVTMAYVNSWIKTTALARVYNEWLKADFDVDDVLRFRNWLGNTYDVNALSAGHPAWKGATTSNAWADSYCDLMSEVNVYGATVWGSSGYDVGCQNQQLALFKLARIEDFFPRMAIWLKAVVSSTDAAGVTAYGSVNTGNASIVRWVCPLANIK